MSKKYSLYINNDNIYSCSGTYKVMDGRGTTLTTETALTLSANGKTKIGEQTLADTTIAYWGGTRFTFSSVGAPVLVSGEISKNDYHYYDLESVPKTYYVGSNFVIKLPLTLTEISGQTISFPKTFLVATNEDFTNSETITFSSAGTQNLTYNQTNFGGDKGSGYIYIKDNDNLAVYVFINTIQKFINATPDSVVITYDGTDTYTASFRQVNNNDIAVNVYAYNDSDTATLKGSISADSNGTYTLTSLLNSGTIHTYLELDGLQTAVSDKAWVFSATLQPIVITSAVMTSANILKVVYNNPNNVACSGTLYATPTSGSASSETRTFTASSQGKYTTINVVNSNGSTYVGPVSASGYSVSIPGTPVDYVSFKGALTISGVASSYYVNGGNEIFALDSSSNRIICSWVSSNTNVATLTQTTYGAYLSIVGAGSATITATATGYTDGTTTLSAVKHSIGIGGANKVIVGETTPLIAWEDDTTDITSECSWSSSDTSVATVSSGVVSGVGIGSATIRASKTNYSSGTASMTVYNPNNVSISATMSKRLKTYYATVDISNSTGLTITSISVGDMLGITLTGSTSCSSGSNVSWGGNSKIILSPGGSTATVSVSYLCGGSIYTATATYDIPS